MSSISDKLNASSSTNEDRYLFAMDLISSGILCAVVKTAIELDLLEILSKAGRHLSCSEIASQLPTKNPNAPEILDRILRYLASFSIVTCKLATQDNINRDQRLYGLSPFSKYLVRNEDGFSLTALMLAEGIVSVMIRNGLKDAVLEEESVPFEKIFGKRVFDFMAQNEEMTKSFHELMNNSTGIIMTNVLQTYKGLDGLKVLVDVGGGLGINLSLIISKYPMIKGINFDLPDVVKLAPPIPGVEHVGGDMFSYVPTGDAIFLKWILHDWSDEECVKILKNCYEALPESGKVIVMETIIPKCPESDLRSRVIFGSDMYMLCGPGAKERTMEEFEVLAREAGFAAIIPAQSFGIQWVIELYKNMPN